jgi:hypothetical protein
MRLAARYVALYVPYSTISFGRHSIVFSFLMAQSCVGVIGLLTWSSNTFARSPSKRAVALAFINGFSQLGSIAGSCVFALSSGTSVIDSYFDEQLYVAKILGSDLYSLLRDLHLDERALYSYVSYLQTGTRQPQ